MFYTRGKPKLSNSTLSSTQTLTYLVNGVVAVFFVNEGIKNVEVIIHLPLPFYPPPV